jgi:uncharacterized membrane protein
MSLKAKESLALLIASGVIYWWFAQRMLDGWEVVDQSPGEIYAAAIGVVVATIIAYAVISGVLAATNRDKVTEDERDHAIDAKATRNELFAIVAAINVFVFHMLGQLTFGADWGGVADLTAPAAIAFYLFSALWLGEWVRLASVLWYSRL